MSIGNILLITVLIALNGFFVAVEFAVVSSRRARLDLEFPQDHSGSNIVRGWLENTQARDRLIAASQLGITLVSLALGAVGENAFEAWLEPIFHAMKLPAWLEFMEVILPALPLIISLTVVTGLHVVLGEQVPKVAALRMAERMAVYSAPIMNVFSKIFKGFIDLLDWATRLVLSLFGMKNGASHTTVYTIEEIKEMVNGPEIQAVIEKQERDMLSAIIDFGGMLVRQFRIPRTEIIAVEASTPVEEIIQLALENSVSKIPVYEENLDQVIGIVHLQDLLDSVRSNHENKVTAREIKREALFVPETISANQLLHHFRIHRKHLAIVLDEFGGTEGLVTLEDLMDEIIGEVYDPFETKPPPIQKLPDGAALIDGLIKIEDVNEHFNINLVDPDYDTIAGFMLGKLGRIARVGDQIEDPENSIMLTVTAMDKLRISQIKLKFHKIFVQKEAVPGGLEADTAETIA